MNERQKDILGKILLPLFPVVIVILEFVLVGVVIFAGIMMFGAAFNIG